MVQKLKLIQKVSIRNMIFSFKGKSLPLKTNSFWEKKIIFLNPGFC